MDGDGSELLLSIDAERKRIGVTLVERQTRGDFVAPGSVRIVGGRVTLLGSKMEIGVSTRRLTLLGDVRVTMARSTGHRS